MRKAIVKMRLRSEELRLDLWKKGLNLSDASYRFAHPDLRATYDQLRSRRIKEVKVEPIQGELTWPKALDAFSKFYQPYAEDFAAKGEAEHRCQDYLLRLILAGEVKTLGYALPRGSEDFPAMIPSDVWPGFVDWPKSSVKGNGLEFVAVRIVTNRTAQNILASSKQGALPALKKTGRPSLKAQIIEAYDALKDAGQIDYERPMAHAFPRLRAWLSERYPNNADQFENMADETIRRQISDLFKQGRISNKQ